MGIPKTALPRTIEIKPARIHTTGKLAGLIEVPMIIGDLKFLYCDINELYLQVEGEDHLLRIAGRGEFEGGLQLTFFSNFVKKTKQLPLHVQLLWGDSRYEEECGMDLSTRNATDENS